MFFLKREMHDCIINILSLNFLFLELWQIYLSLKIPGIPMGIYCK